MKAKLFFFTGICICLITCKKEKEDKNPDKPIIVVDSLLIGIDTNVIINPLDTLLIGGYNNKQSIDLDIDGNKTYDFRFTSEIWGSPGLGQHPRSTILSLNNNCMIYGVLKTDSSILHRESGVYIGSDSSIIKYSYNTYTCRRISTRDSVIDIVTGKFKLTPKNKGDILSKSDVFRSDTITLADESYSYPVFLTNNGDTIIYDVTTFDYTCDILPSDFISFIGIKIKGTNSDKLGWIKINISEKYKIFLIESAVQK